MEEGKMKHIHNINECLLELDMMDFSIESINNKAMGEGKQCALFGQPLFFTTDTFAEYCTSAQIRCRAKHLVRIRGSFSLWQFHNKKNERIAQNILRQLMNERGPWGNYTSLDSRKVYWALDNAGTDLNVRMLLKPEPRANGHEKASKIQESGIQSLEQNDEETAEDPLLFKNLFKYQTAKSVAIAIKRQDTKEKERDKQDSGSEKSDVESKMEDEIDTGKSKSSLSLSLSLSLV